MANGETSSAKTERRFYNAKGEESPRAKEDTVRAKISFLGENGGVLEFSKEDFTEGVFNAGGFFGLVTSITNAAGGKHATATPFERAEDRLNTLAGEEGEWQGEREGGPQTGVVLDACERLGYDRAQVKTALADGKLTLAQLSAAEGVEDMVYTIKAERLEERRKAAKAKDKTGGVDLKALLG